MVFIVSVSTKIALLVVVTMSRDTVVGGYRLHDMGIGFLAGGRGFRARLHGDAGNDLEWSLSPGEKEIAEGLQRNAALFTVRLK